MSHTTESDSGGAGIIGKNSGVAVAIILSSLFALILFILLVMLVACLLPKCIGTNDETREKRRKERIEKLDSSVKAEGFVDWANKERNLHPERAFANVLCVICLEEFEDAAQVRGLGCHHVFHQECLDDWFRRWNEFCPLCHRPIIPGDNTRKKPGRGEVNDSQRYAFMV